MVFILIICNMPLFACRFLLRPNVGVSQGLLTLDALGDLDCASSVAELNARKELSRIVLARVFAASPDLRWSRSSLEDRYQQSRASTQLTFAGAEDCRVYMVREELAESEILDAVTKRIREILGASEPVRIRYINPPRTIQLPASDWTLELDTRQIKQGQIRLKIRQDQRILFQHFLRFEILRHAVVLRLKKNLKKGEAIEAQYLSIEEDWVADKSFLASSAILRSTPRLRAARDVKAGTVLSTRDTLIEAAIRQRQMVNGHLQTNGLQLRLRVEAQKDGAEGDIIDVTAPDTRKRFRARVIDGENVEILP